MILSFRQAEYGSIILQFKRQSDEEGDRNMWTLFIYVQTKSIIAWLVEG